MADGIKIKHEIQGVVIELTEDSGHELLELLDLLTEKELRYRLAFYRGGLPGVKEMVNHYGDHEIFPLIKKWVKDEISTFVGINIDSVGEVL